MLEIERLDETTADGKAALLLRDELLTCINNHTLRMHLATGRNPIVCADVTVQRLMSILAQMLFHRVVPVQWPSVKASWKRSFQRRLDEAPAIAALIHDHTSDGMTKQ